MSRLPNDFRPGRAADDLDTTVGFYDAVAAGYDARVDGRPDSAKVRESFCELVSSIAGPASVILDFGCGTGADAAWYAARGHRVIAYDISPHMVDLLRQRCTTEIESTRVTALAGGLDVMTRALADCGPVSVIAANFAVLNHVRELKPLLHLLASHLVPEGALVASVLNPFYLADMRRAWWWRGALRSRWTGAIRVEGSVTTYRHFIGAIRKAIESDFVLSDIRAASGDSRLGSLGSNFLFLVLRKLP